MITLLSKFGNWFLRNSRNAHFALITGFFLFIVLSFHHSFAAEKKKRPYSYVICEPKAKSIRLYDFPDNYYYWESHLEKEYFAIISSHVDVYLGQYLLGRVYTDSGKELNFVSYDGNRENDYFLNEWYLKSEEWRCSFEEGIRDKMLPTGEFENIKEKFDLVRLHSLVSNETTPYYTKSIGCAVKDHNNMPRLFINPDASMQFKDHVYRDSNPSFSFDKYHITAEGTFMEGRIVDGRARPILRRIDLPERRYRLIGNWFVLPEEWGCSIYQ